MTLPRPVLPGKTYLVSRRCTQRERLLTPSAAVNNILLYCAAVGSERFNVDIHALCGMPNHWHPHVTDHDGRYPEFLAWVHKNISKCRNASLGRWENLWASEQPSVRPTDDEAGVINAMVYVLTNPVKDALVARGRDWPGVLLGPESWGKDIVVPRPEYHFRDDGTMPPHATLRLKRPPICPDLSDEQLAERIQAAVYERECHLRQQHRKEGRRILGRTAVLKRSPTSRPTSREPRRHRASKPQKSTVRRALKAFVDSYRETLAQWKAGVRDVIFPPGTYMLRLHAGVTCLPP